MNGSANSAPAALSSLRSIRVEYGTLNSSALEGASRSSQPGPLRARRKGSDVPMKERRSMPTASSTLPAMHVVQVRYQGGERSRPEGDPIDAYAASGVFDGFTTTVVEPIFPEERRDAEPTVNLGLIGGEIAEIG